MLFTCFGDRWLAETQLVMTLSTGDWLNPSWWWLCQQVIGWIMVMILLTGDWQNRIWSWLCQQVIGWIMVMILLTGDWQNPSWWWLCQQVIGWITADDDFVDRRLAEMWSGCVHKHCSCYSLIGDHYTWTLYITVTDYNHCCWTGLSVFPLLSWDGLWLTGHGEKKKSDC